MNDESNADDVKLTALGASRALVSGGRRGSRVTLDGGATWQLTPYPNTVGTASGRAWIIDADGRLLQSEDLGLTIARAVPLAGRFDAVHFADDRQGWAHATVDGTGEARRHVVYRTADGGATWVAAASVGLPDTLATPYTTARVTAFDGTTAWLSLARNIQWFYEFQFDYRSTDGGASWQPVARPADSERAAVNPAPTQPLTVLSPQVAWARQGTGAYITRNGGADWKLLSPGYTGASPAQLLMPAPDALLASYGDFGPLLRSTDGGNAWSVQFKGRAAYASISNREIGRAAHFVDASRWWVSAGVDLYETRDAGLNWTPLINGTLTAPTGAVRRASRLQAVSGTRARFLTTVNTHTTDDGGANWTSAGLPFAGPLLQSDPHRDADFRDERRGLHVSDETITWGVTPPPPPVAGFAYATLDGAASWTSAVLPVSPRSVRWVNDTTAIVVGTQGGIARSTDAGLTWTVTPSGTQATLHRLTVNGSIVWAVGDAGTVLRSDDAGLTWKAVATRATARLAEVRFFDARNGYIVGDAGTVLATTDGGDRWTLQATGTTQDLTAVHLSAPGLATIVTARGDLLSTVTGGY